MAVALTLPPLAAIYLPVLKAQAVSLWPAMQSPAILAGQVEQETCPSLRSAKCWNPRAELKTSREYGFGLGQLTVTRAFNNFVAARGWDPSLRGWQWSQRFDPVMQLRALVAYDRNLYARVPAAASFTDRMAFTLSAYNGGLGGLLKDVMLCRNSAGCNPDVWWGNVADHSFRAKVAVKGYGQSFYQINRQYVINVIRVRAPRYEAWFKEHA